MVDALVAKAEEGRRRQRNLLGNRQQVKIQQCPNGATPAAVTRLKRVTLGNYNNQITRNKQITDHEIQFHKQ